MPLLQQITSKACRRIPILVIVLLALLPPLAPPAMKGPPLSPEPVNLSTIPRVPGVVAGNSATYAASSSWQTNNPTAFPDPFNGLSQYSSVSASVLQVTSVSGSNVTSTTTLDYPNGTSSIFIIENVDVATQNVCFTSPHNPGGKNCSLGDPRLPAPFIASGLQTPDTIGSNPEASLNITRLLTVLGTQRTVNMFNLTITTPSNCISIEGTPCPNTTILGMSWDRSSGMMIDDSITELYSSALGSAIGRFSLEIIATDTWPTITQASKMTLSCDQQTIDTGLFTTCTVTVTPTPPSITVLVTTSTRTGLFNPPGSPQTGACRLVNGKCSLGYTDVSSENTFAAIQAVLQGPLAIAAYTGLSIIRPSNIISLKTSLETVQAGSAAADHSLYTGVTVTVTSSGAPDGTNALFTSKILSLLYQFGNSPDYIGGGVPLSSPKFYFVAVNGLTTGTARICADYPGSGPMTTMRYGDNGDPAFWANATNLETSGASFCGNIPASLFLFGKGITIGNILDNSSPQPLQDNLLLSIELAAPIALIICGTIVVMRLRKRSTLLKISGP